MLENGVKLGASSLGSGNVKEDGSREVFDFEIITVDVVAQPVSWSIFHTSIYEHLMNARGGYKAYELAQATKNDTKAQRYLKESLVNITQSIPKKLKKENIMLDALKTLFENDVVSQKCAQEIQEAWNNKIKENLLEVTAELPAKSLLPNMHMTKKLWQKL